MGAPCCSFRRALSRIVQCTNPAVPSQIVNIDHSSWSCKVHSLHSHIWRLFEFSSLSCYKFFGIFVSLIDEVGHLPRQDLELPIFKITLYLTMCFP